MKKKIFTLIKYTFFLGLGLGLLYFAFRNTNPHKMFLEMKEANYFWVSASVLVGIFAYYSRAARWLILLEPMGYKPKISNSLYSVLFGYFANLAAPRVGELARCTALNQTEKIPLNALIGTVLLERVIDVVILFLLIVLSVFLNAGLFGKFFLDVFKNKIQSSGNLNLIYLAIGFGFIIIAAIYFWRKKIASFSFFLKIKTFLSGVVEGFVSIGKMKKKWSFIAHTTTIWASYIVMAYVGFFALKETQHLTFADGIFITVVGGLGMAVPSNGGIGTYHASVMFGLAALGIENETGLVFATIMHASQVLFIILLGTFSFTMLYLKKNKKKDVKL